MLITKLRSKITDFFLSKYNVVVDIVALTKKSETVLPQYKILKIAMTFFFNFLSQKLKIMIGISCEDVFSCLVLVGSTSLKLKM